MSSFIAKIIGDNHLVSETISLSNIRITDDKSTEIINKTQTGGNKNSAKNHEDSNINVNKLLSMLTSTTSESYNIETLQNKNLTGGNDSITSIDTQILEDKLMSLLGKDSHEIKNINKLDNSYNNLFTTQNGGNSNINISDVKNFFKDLKSKGINVDVKLNDQTFSEFFDMAATTTNINNTLSATSLENIVNNKVKGINTENNLSATSLNNMSAINKKQMGGKQLDPIMSITSTENILNNKIMTMHTDDHYSATSEAHIDTILQQGGKGMSDGFKAFLDLKKYVAKKLNMPNGPEAGKIAGAVQREAKLNFPNESGQKISNEAMKMFDKNMEKYKKIAAEYKSDTPKKKSKKSKKN